MKKNSWLVSLGIILGIILFIIGLVYVTHPAARLPHFFPGYDATMTIPHYKHGIAAFIVGIACFVYAWFMSGPKRNTAN